MSQARRALTGSVLCPFRGLCLLGGDGPNGLVRPGVTYHPCELHLRIRVNPRRARAGHALVARLGRSNRQPPFVYSVAASSAAATRANSLPGSSPKSHRLFHGREAVRCRVYAAFLHYFWTPECNAFCPETCRDSRCKPVARADVRRRLRLLFGSRSRGRRQGQDPAKAQRSLKSFGGAPGGVPVARTPLGEGKIARFRSGAAFLNLPEKSIRTC